MFTGLVQHVGHMDHVQFQGDAGRLALTAPIDAPLVLGESIAVDGACLTLVEHAPPRLVFDVLHETFDKTSLRHKSPGAPLNLERALRMGDPIGGHLVSGHVDGTGTVRRIGSAGRDFVLEIHAPDLVPDMVPKGSIAIDGVSLTLVDVAYAPGTFTVHVIPHTWTHTALAALQPGSPVNLETDMIGKYVRAALAAQTSDDASPPATWQTLRNAGYLD
jgi:riboflavin synthase